MQTPLGIVYGLIPREVVDYPTTLRLQEPLSSAPANGGSTTCSVAGKAIRYGIAVGMEGYAWSGVKYDCRQTRMAGLDAHAR